MYVLTCLLFIFAGVLGFFMNAPVWLAIVFTVFGTGCLVLDLLAKATREKYRRAGKLCRTCGGAGEVAITSGGAMRRCPDCVGRGYRTVA